MHGGTVGAADDRRRGLFTGFQAGLTVFGILLFGIGMAYALGGGSVLDPGAFGDDTDDSEPDENGNGDEPSPTEDDDRRDADVDATDATEVADDSDGNDEDDSDGNDESDDAEDGTATDDGGDELADPDTAAFMLTVVGPAGERIEGADVSIQGAPHDAEIPLEYDGETDSNGVYTDEIYENEYTITVDHPAYEAATAEHTHDGDRRMTVGLDRPGDDEPVSTYQLTIRAVDPTGEPIEGATVHGEGEPHETDLPRVFRGETGSDGTYTDVVYENEYRIGIDHPEYEGGTVTYTHDGDREVIVELEPRDGGERDENRGRGRRG